MSIDATIRTALTPIVPIVKPNVYTGSETEYCVFNYSELPTGFGDNAPHAIRYLVQLHWFAPWRTESGVAINPNTKKKQIKQALLNADFTYPSTTNASDGEGQHFVFETEYCDGNV
jgi:hypothetical protein